MPARGTGSPVGAHTIHIPHPLSWIYEGFSRVSSSATGPSHIESSLSWSLCPFLREGWGGRPWQGRKRKTPEARGSFPLWPLPLGRSRPPLVALDLLAPTLAF